MPGGPLIRLALVSSSHAVGGLEKLLEHLHRELDRERFDPHLLLLAGRGPFVERMERLGGEGVEVFDLRSARAPAETLRLLARLRRLRPDVIHAFGLKGDLLSRLARRALGRPALVSTVANPDLARRRLVRAWNRLSSGRVEVFWADCRARAAEAERLGIPPAKVRVVYPGVEVPPEDAIESRERAFETVRRELGLGADARLLALIGDLRQLKGHHHAIEAAEAIVAAEPRAHLLFVGHDASAGAIPAIAQRSPVRDHLHLLGYRDDPLPYLRAAEALLQPSLSEGLPRAVLEATSVARPVVAARVGGLPEVIEDGENGRLIAAGDSAELAAATLELLAEAGRARAWGRRGRERAAERFEQRRMVDELEAIYEAAAAAGS